MARLRIIIFVIGLVITLGMTLAAVILRVDFHGEFRVRYDELTIKGKYSTGIVHEVTASPSPALFISVDGEPGIAADQIYRNVPEGANFLKQVDVVSKGGIDYRCHYGFLARIDASGAQTRRIGFGRSPSGPFISIPCHRSEFDRMFGSAITRFSKPIGGGRFPVDRVQVNTQPTKGYTEAEHKLQQNRIAGRQDGEEFDPKKLKAEIQKKIEAQKRETERLLEEIRVKNEKNAADLEEKLRKIREKNAAAKK